MEDTVQLFPFRSGRVSIDLTATFAWHGRKHGDDRLESSAALDAWIEQSPLGDAALPSTPDELDAARRLRAAIYRLASTSAFGAAFDDDSVNSLNAFAASAPTAPRLRRLHEQYTLERTPSVASRLAEIAIDAIQLFASPLASRIRECEHPPCWVLFVDTTALNSRRWCSVHCGQLVAARNYRQRRKAELASAGG